MTSTPTTITTITTITITITITTTNNEHSTQPSSRFRTKETHAKHRDGTVPPTRLANLSSTCVTTERPCARRFELCIQPEAAPHQERQVAIKGCGRQGAPRGAAEGARHGKLEHLVQCRQLAPHFPLLPLRCTKSRRAFIATVAHARAYAGPRLSH